MTGHYTTTYSAYATNIARKNFGRSQIPIQMLSWALHLTIKRLDHETNFSLACNGRIKDAWILLPLPLYAWECCAPIYSKWSSKICCSMPCYLFVTTILLCERIFVLWSSNFFLLHHKINEYHGVNEASKQHRNLV